MKCKPETLKIVLPVIASLMTALTSCASNLPTPATSVPGIGLSLTVSISSTDYKPGSKIIITIDETNTLAHENNVSAANAWPLKGLTLGGCGTLNYPFGLAILQGNYDQTNFTSVTPLQSLYDLNAVYSCPMLLQVTSYVFEASSDFAFINSGTAYTNRAQISYTCDVAGSWSGSPSAIYSNFTPGIYTVVGGDEWGTVVIEHFTVVGA